MIKRSPQARAVISNFKKLPKPTEAQAEAALDQLAREGEKHNPPPEDVPARLRDRVYCLNETVSSLVTVFYLHGGGYQFDFSPFDWGFLKTAAERTGAAILAPAYTLIPFGNCKDAFGWISPLYRDYVSAHPDKKIVLIGSSSGGGLALALTEEFRQEGVRLPDELILLSPWVDVTMENPEIRQFVRKDPWLTVPWLRVCGRRWAGEYDVKDPRVSPLYGDVSGLRHVTVFVGTRELFYPDVTALFARLDGETNELIVGQDLNHVFPILPMPEAAPAVDRIVETILR